jgi:acyl carrier protein
MTTDLITTLSNFIVNSILKQPDRTLSPNEPIISTGLIDSFSLVDLALFIEETFGVRIEDTELNKDAFDNLNQLAAIVKSRLA